MEDQSVLKLVQLNKWDVKFAAPEIPKNMTKEEASCIKQITFNDNGKQTNLFLFLDDLQKGSRKAAPFRSNPKRWAELFYKLFSFDNGEIDTQSAIQNIISFLTEGSMLNVELDENERNYILTKIQSINKDSLLPPSLPSSSLLPPPPPSLPSSSLLPPPPSSSLSLPENLESILQGIYKKSEHVNWNNRGPKLASAITKNKPHIINLQELGAGLCKPIIISRSENTALIGKLSTTTNIWQDTATAMQYADSTEIATNDIYITTFLEIMFYEYNYVCIQGIEPNRPRGFDWAMDGQITFVLKDDTIKLDDSSTQSDKPTMYVYSKIESDEDKTSDTLLPVKLSQFAQKSTHVLSLDVDQRVKGIVFEPAKTEHDEKKDAKEYKGKNRTALVSELTYNDQPLVNITLHGQTKDNDPTKAPNWYVKVAELMEVARKLRNEKYNNYYKIFTGDLNLNLEDLKKGHLVHHITIKHVDGEIQMLDDSERERMYPNYTPNTETKLLPMFKKTDKGIEFIYDYFTDTDGIKYKYLLAQFDDPENEGTREQINQNGETIKERLDWVFTNIHERLTDQCKSEYVMEEGIKLSDHKMLYECFKIPTSIDLTPYTKIHEPAQKGGCKRRRYSMKHIRRRTKKSKGLFRKKVMSLRRRVRRFLGGSDSTRHIRKQK